MLNYAETASSSTNVPVAPASSHRPHVGTIPDAPFSPSPSLPHPYVVGPLDSTQATTRSVHLPDSEAVSILVPAHLSPSWFTTRAFAEGCEEGATLEDDYLHEGEEWTIPGLLNLIYRNLMDLYRYDTDPHIGPWTLGFVCSFLTRVAERDRTLALTGLARADSYHIEVLRAYRARVRVYREQGKSFTEAQRLALC